MCFLSESGGLNWVGRKSLHTQRYRNHNTGPRWTSNLKTQCLRPFLQVVFFFCLFSRALYFAGGRKHAVVIETYSHISACREEASAVVVNEWWNSNEAAFCFSRMTSSRPCLIIFLRIAHGVGLIVRIAWHSTFPAVLISSGMHGTYYLQLS